MFGIDGIGLLVIGGLIGFLIAMAFSLTMDWVHIKKKDNGNKDKGVADEFEKIWDMADNKAREAWLLQQKEEIPKDFSAEEDKKFMVLPKHGCWGEGV
jgi:hypothetical protein